MSMLSREVNSHGLLAACLVVTAAILGPSTTAFAQARVFTADDYVRVQRIRGAAWSPDGRYVAIAVSRPSRWVDGTIQTNDINVLDATTRAMRVINPQSGTYLGFFSPLWSPDGRYLTFLSVDNDAVVRVWLWRPGDRSANAVPDIDVTMDPGDAPLVWLDATRLAVRAWDGRAKKQGGDYATFLRGRNAADKWAEAREGRAAAVSVVSSGGRPDPGEPTRRIVIVDVNTRTARTVARGQINRMSVAADGCCIVYFRHTRDLTMAQAFTLAERDLDAAYAAARQGTAREAVNATTGAAVDPATLTLRPPVTRPAIEISLPRPSAVRIATARRADAALFLANDADGSRLWIAGGGGRALTDVAEIWRGNEWMREISLGRPQSVTYAGPGGSSLTAWLLLPPGYQPGQRIPLVVAPYPGRILDATPPNDFSPYSQTYSHPQLYAALGYGVLLPSVPQDPDNLSAPEPMTAAVLAAVDAAVATGIVDPGRVAVAGYSGGGFLTLTLITQTNRFRSAIAFESYANLFSLYGTFYGHYRDGDAGPPETGQQLRALMLERGFMGLGGPPWAQRERYLHNSPIMRADKVETPVMLVHGTIDFIPIQQAEEFFTALMRQDKRAVLVRYHGEEHGPVTRENILDLWKRIPRWLDETMRPSR